MTAQSAWPDELFGDERLDSGAPRPPVWLLAESGWRHKVEPSRWHRLTRADASVLERAEPSVLDVGCGPGRHVAALARAGCDALGIDTSLAAVAATRRRGAAAELVSVFAEVPHVGRWSTVLLLDGNVGIGGRPHALLTRCRQLLRPGGMVLVETEPPGAVTRRGRVRVLHAGAPRDPWFDWATLSVNDVHDHAQAAGLAVDDVWDVDDRWFAKLVAL